MQIGKRKFLRKLKLTLLNPKQTNIKQINLFNPELKIYLETLHKIFCNCNNLQSGQHLRFNLEKVLENRFLYAV